MGRGKEETQKIKVSTEGKVQAIELSQCQAATPLHPHNNRDAEKSETKANEPERVGEITPTKGYADAAKNAATGGSIQFAPVKCSIFIPTFTPNKQNDYKPITNNIQKTCTIYSIHVDVKTK